MSTRKEIRDAVDGALGPIWLDGLAELDEAVAEVSLAVDRWLEQHDAKVRADELRAAAADIYAYAYQPSDVFPVAEQNQKGYLLGASNAHDVVDRLLNERADKITERES